MSKPTMHEGVVREHENSVKIMIAVPSRGGVWTSDFGMSLAMMVGYTASAPHVGERIDLLLNNSLNAGLCMNRIALVRKALEKGCGFILFLDDDMRLPTDMLLRLLEARKDIVGCNYVRKELPPRSIAAGFDGNCVYTTEKSTGLQKVKSLGFGAILIKTSVFLKVREPWFFEDPVKEIGEDVHFCYRAREAGYEIWIDHDLSKDVVHIGQFQYTHQLCDQWKGENTDDNELHRT
jgi:glycosyltransferase involved in cell wall biosynthesis